MQEKKYIGELDFFKFIFALVIMCMHVYQTYGGETAVFKYGTFAVSFFFIVSGYLMCASAERKSGETGVSAESPGKETIAFIWKKVKALFLPYLIVFGVNWLLWLVGTGREIVADSGIKQFIDSSIVRIPNFLLLSMSGILSNRIISNISWYVSAMLIAMLILYPLVRKYGQSFRLIAAPLIYLFGTGYLYQTECTYREIDQFVLFATGGMWRAVIDICVGCMAYELGNFLMKKKFLKSVKVLFSLATVALFTVVMYIMWSGTRETGYVVNIFLFFFVSLIVSRQSALSHMFDNKVCLLLGKASMYVYFLHIAVRNVVCHIWKKGTVGGVAPYILVALFTALLVSITMYIDSLIRKKHKGSV